MNEIKRIEIELPFPMEVEDAVFMQIDNILSELVCKKYKATHPERTMWVSGHGCKPHYSQVDAAILGVDADPTVPNGEEPRYEDDVYQITITEREKY